MFSFVRVYPVGVVAVYALNDEFKSIMREAKNGMTRGFTCKIGYRFLHLTGSSGIVLTMLSSLLDVVAKSLLTLPFIMVLSICCLGIPAFVIMDVPGEGAIAFFIVFAALLFVFESCAEFFSILFEDPILGMLQFMNFWCKSLVQGILNSPTEGIAIFPY